MNKYLAAGFFALSLVAVYLFGRTRTLSQMVVKNQNQPTPSTNLTNTPTPTSKPTVVNKPAVKAATQPPERKKVSVTVTEVGVAGTYYCYEDKANVIAQKQSDLNNLHKIFNFCADDLRFKIGNCNYTDPSSSCPSGTECNDKSNEVMKAQDELRGLIQSYCP